MMCLFKGPAKYKHQCVRVSVCVWPVLPQESLNNNDDKNDEEETDHSRQTDEPRLEGHRPRPCWHFKASVHIWQNTKFNNS